MNRIFTPRLVALEDRTVPATFGNPWLDGMHVTLSFAPDGTNVSGVQSDLSSYLADLGPAARLNVLRAFQTWAIHANLNVGLVGDGGQAFSSGGAIQGDARFGDIRIGGRALAGDVLTVTAPFNLFGTNSGNVVLNTSAGVGTKRDLFTVFLQEAGHSFGVGNSADVSSAMYEWYQGARTGLSAADISAIQALYGARSADAFEGGIGNGTLATATGYQSGLEADLTTLGDVDVYKFKMPFLMFGSKISLKAEGLSLLTAKLELIDANGKVLAQETASNPLDNDLTINVSSLKSGATYFVRVSGAKDDVFGIGSYKLDVNNYGLLGSVLGLVNLLSTELGLNDTLSAATGLVSSALSLGSRADYVVRASLLGPTDLDYYRIHSPEALPGQPVHLIAAV